ncbi:serine carboxypeptidase-like protein 26, partial [Tanacetum coccineum]
AEDTYVFLLNWLERYPLYKGRDLYLSGEGYAGYYIPELADVILHNSKDLSHVINLKGMMVGNGYIDDQSDTKGVFDFAWSHSFISDENHEELREKCPVTFHKSPTCSEAIVRIREGMGNINFLDLYSPQCQPSIINHPPTNKSHPCDLLYVQTYLNNPHVQAALNANGTNLPYTWEPCSDVIWSKDNPVTMFPVYERLMASGLPILLYSGDVDASVPVSGTRYALARMALEVIEPWSWWSTSDTFDVAGYKEVYRGLTYFTVMGAGHDVSQTHPDKLFRLFDYFIGGEPS